MSLHKNEALSFNQSEYTEFSELLCKICGIELGPNKQYLVSTRIRRILIDHDLKSLKELTRRISQGGDKLLLQNVIDAMTTNETFWFRDSYPFDYLKNTLLPKQRLSKSTRKIRIWSAACSSGQEPYSISMLVDETAQNLTNPHAANTEIIATDLSSRILESAKKAHYDKLAIIRGLSKERVKKYFSQVDSETWKVDDLIQSRVTFRPLNLQESFFLLGKFDVVFCRNVLIYFSSELKEEILKKIHATLLPGGLLFLGSSESVSGLNDYFELIHCNPGIAYQAKVLRR